MPGSRSRVGLLLNSIRRRALDTQESRSRSGLSHDLLGNRATARHVLAIAKGLTLQQPACSTWPPGVVLLLLLLLLLSSHLLESISIVHHPSPERLGVTKLGCWASSYNNNNNNNNKAKQPAGVPGA
eukprot:2817774-Pyramimonas_sp.AAC.1